MSQDQVSDDLIEAELSHDFNAVRAISCDSWNRSKRAL